MKLYLILVLLLTSLVARAANIVVFDPASTPVANRVVSYVTSADTSVWLGNPNALINPAMPAGVAVNLLKVSGGAVVAMTQAELDSIAAAAAAALIASTKAGGKTVFDNNFNDGRVLRAIVGVLLDEINTLRTNAALGLPARTPAQARTAIQAKIDAQP